MTLLALQDLFQRHRERATGIWKLGQEPDRTIFIDSGDVVFAQSTHPLDRLTHLLVEKGKLTREQMDYAMANLKPGFSIGKNLIDMGFITQRDLLEVARAQVERVVWGAVGTPDLEPEFASHELDASIVRLPLDTPSLLLNCLLNLQDRERLLELLGPLNQVVLLQGRRLQELPLPQDLSKLPPLLDGSRTLLELSREVSVEPIRLGILALFLREMGWAKLHELPPIDRQALDMALAPELAPVPLLPLEPAPEPLPEPAPTLFTTIQAAAAPTTNLEHLSRAFDALPEPFEVPASSDPSPSLEIDLSFRAEAERQMLPTPSAPLPTILEEPAPEPAVKVLPPALLGDESHPGPESTYTPPLRPAEPGRVRVILLLVTLVVVAAAAYLWYRRRPSPEPPPRPIESRPPTPRDAPVRPGIAVPVEKPAVDLPPVPQQPPTTPSAKPEPRQEPPQTEPRKPESAKPEPPKPERKTGPASLEDRLEAIRKGTLAVAVSQGEAYRRNLPAGRWTLRLEIACEAETIRNAVGFFGSRKPDLFLLPLALKDGRTCYQVFLGNYASKAAAEKEIKGLPSAFTTLGNRPRPYTAGDIPSKL